MRDILFMREQNFYYYILSLIRHNTRERETTLYAYKLSDFIQLRNLRVFFIFYSFN